MNHNISFLKNQTENAKLVNHFEHWNKSSIKKITYPYNVGRKPLMQELTPLYRLASIYLPWSRFGFIFRWSEFWESSSRRCAKVRDPSFLFQNAIRGQLWCRILDSATCRHNCFFMAIFSYLMPYRTHMVNTI